MAEIILSPMSLNDSGEKVNFDSENDLATTSAAAVDGNDIETTKGCEEEEVVSSSSLKTLASALLPQHLQLTITESSCPTTGAGQGDDESIEVEVKCTTTTGPSAASIQPLDPGDNNIREVAQGPKSSSSSPSPSPPPPSDLLDVRADDNSAAGDTGIVDDEVDYQPDFSEASNGAREGDNSGSIGTKASSVSPLKGDNGIMS